MATDAKAAAILSDSNRDQIRQKMKRLIASLILLALSSSASAQGDVPRQTLFKNASIFNGTDRGVQGMQNMTWEEIGALAYESARECLAAGVTTVRDLCGMSQGLRKHIDSNALEGPRIYTSGTCLGQSSGHGDWRWDPSVLRDDGSKSNLELLGITKLTDGADAVLGASRNNLAGGADFVKISLITPTTVIPTFPPMQRFRRSS